MADITEDRTIDKMCGEKLGDLLNPTALIPVGAMFVLDADGFAVPATASASAPVRGIALRRADGPNGDDKVLGAAKGVYRFQNSETAPLTAADIGLGAAVEDCHTVCKGEGCVAGVVFDVNDEGVWVELGRKP